MIKKKTKGNFIIIRKPRADTQLPNGPKGRLQHFPREGARPRRRGGRSGPAPRETVTGTPGACSPLPASVQLKPRPDFAFRTILSLTFQMRKVISGSSPVLPLGALSPSSTPPSLPRAAPGDGAEAARGLTSGPGRGRAPSRRRGSRVSTAVCPRPALRLRPCLTSTPDGCAQTSVPHLITPPREGWLGPLTQTPNRKNTLEINFFLKMLRWFGQVP